MLKQQTLKGSFSLNGKGLHTGMNLTVTFNPAPDNHGYKIQRIDVEGQPILDAVMVYASVPSNMRWLPCMLPVSTTV